MKRCKTETSVFRKIVENQVSLMVGVHADDIIVYGEQGMYV